MTDLITAAQQALDALNLVSDEGESKFPATLQGAISDLEAALTQQAEPVEPVAWAGWWLHHGQHNYRATPLTSERVKELMKLAFEVGRESAPPQRKPLTEDQIGEALSGVIGIPHEVKVEIARDIEHAHDIH